MSKRQINYDIDKSITAKRLIEAMHEAEITLTELAEKSGIKKSSISHYTHGTQSPSNISSMAMAKVLNVSPVWLMGFDVPKSRELFLRNQQETSPVTPRELELIYKLRELDEDGLNFVLTALDNEYKRTKRLAEYQRIVKEYTHGKK